MPRILGITADEAERLLQGQWADRMFTIYQDSGPGQRLDLYVYGIFSRRWDRFRLFAKALVFGGTAVVMLGLSAFLHGGNLLFVGAFMLFCGLLFLLQTGDVHGSAFHRRCEVYSRWARERTVAAVRAGHARLVGDIKPEDLPDVLKILGRHP